MNMSALLTKVDKIMLELWSNIEYNIFVLVYSFEEVFPNNVISSELGWGLAAFSNKFFVIVLLDIFQTWCFSTDDTVPI